jgi:hypothetical protein
MVIGLGDGWDSADEEVAFNLAATGGSRTGVVALDDGGDEECDGWDG